MEPTESRREATIAARKQEEKSVLLEQLKKTPIIQIACEKSAVSRATYYRWRKEDGEFAQKADEAIHHGSDLVSDMAESQLLAAIRDRNLTAIIFWLKHHHSSYATRVEVNATLNTKQPMTPEREMIVRAALEYGSLSTHKPSIVNLYEQTTKQSIIDDAGGDESGDFGSADQDEGNAK